MAAQPIDYDALAKQHGAVAPAVDYDSLAKQHGAVSSAPAADAGGEKEGAVSRFLAPLDPRPLVHAMFKPSDDPKEDPRVTFGKNLKGIAANVANGSIDQAHAAVEAFKSGDYTSALGHALYSAPVVGPIANRASEDFQSGNVAGGLGGVAAIVGPKAIEEAAPAVAAAGDYLKQGAKAAGTKALALADSPGAVNLATGAGQIASAPVAAVTGHPIVAGGLALRGAQNISTWLKERAAAANAVPAAYDEISRSLMGGTPYAELSEARKSLVQQVAAKMDAPRVPQASPAAPQGPPLNPMPPESAPGQGLTLSGLVDDIIAKRKAAEGAATEPGTTLVKPPPAPETASTRGPLRPPLGNGASIADLATQPKPGSISLDSARQMLDSDAATIRAAQNAPMSGRSIADMSRELNESLGKTMPEITVKPPKDFEGPARAARAKQLAEFLYQQGAGTGIPHEAALRMTPSDWKLAAQGAKLKSVPSPATVKLALDMLHMVELSK